MQKTRLAYSASFPWVPYDLDARSHRCEIAPKLFQTIRSSKERGEVRGIHQHDVSGSFVAGRHPDESVQFFVARLGEGMWPGKVNRLTRQKNRSLLILRGERIVRKMGMEIERRNVLEQAKFVQIPVGRQRRDLLRARHQCRTEAVLIDHRD